MRVRSEEKRNQIVRAAASLFEEVGYERTSMGMIAERMSGSKQTLYNYFPSKEDLLRAVLETDVGGTADQVIADLLGEKNLRKALIAMGVHYLSRQLGPLAMANVRTAATQVGDSTLGSEFYENVLRPAWTQLSDAFRRMMSDGRLRRGDPWVAAMHWKGLVQFDLFERRLLGAISEPDPKEMEAAAKLAADAFLKIYGPAPATTEA